MNLTLHFRVPVARLRTSVHGLNEDRDWPLSIPTPTPVEERVCDLCGVLEDEEHFLIICPLLDNSDRAKLSGRCTSL